MQLTQELFERIVGGDPRLEAYRNDRRTADRVPIRRCGECAVLKSGRVLAPRVPCLVLELSHSEAAIVTAPAVPVGSDLVLFLKDGEGQERAIECRTARLEPSGSSTKLFTVVATFVRLYSLEANEQLRKQASVDTIRSAILS
jgi:hypothetical protein